MGRRKERKKAQNSSNKKKLQKPTVNAQKLQFCKLQKKYAPRGTVVHNLIALSYYLHTKSSTKKVYSRENCVGRKSKDQRTRSSDLGYKKISLNPRTKLSVAAKFLGKHPQLLLEKATGKKAPLREATNETKWPKMQVKGGEVRKDKNWL